MPLSGTSSLGENVRFERCSPPMPPIIGIKRKFLQNVRLSQLELGCDRHAACWVDEGGTFPFRRSVSVISSRFVECAHGSSCVVSLGGFDRVVRSQTESD